MKAITYNILDGFENAPERKTACALWLKNQKPDVVFLNELNFFTAESLGEFAQEWGHSHSFLLEGKSRYRIGITSNAPIADIESHFENLKGHGVITCKSNGLYLINTHLNPHCIDKRHHDLDFILEKIRSVEKKEDNILFGGDLNSFHISEKSHYDDVVSDVRKYYIFRSKLHEHFKNLKNNELDFSLPERLLESSMIDLLNQCNDKFQKSTSTELGKSMLIAEKMFVESGFDLSLMGGRIDYLWASQKLAQKCVACRIPNDPPVEMISDHYPVVAEFDLTVD